jgi:helix-turn-helix protein
VEHRSLADDPARFLTELRQLRDGAGLEPAELAARAHYPYDRIRAAEAGPALPDLPVLSAYVRGCGGTTEDWEERWRSLTSAQTLPLLAARPAGSSTAASAGARIGSISPAADTPDPSIILAALDRVAEGMAIGNPAPALAPLPLPLPSRSEVSTIEQRPDGAPDPVAGADEPDAGRVVVTPTRSAADVPASASFSTAAPGRVVGDWRDPALSRTKILTAIAVVICILVAALAFFG